MIPSALLPALENCVHSSDYRDQKPHGYQDGKLSLGIQMFAQLLWFWGIPSADWAHGAQDVRTGNNQWA